jgi:HD-GYP domain-containing protein (c-di-GMP phosphodiesterase class II)
MGSPAEALARTSRPARLSPRRHLVPVLLATAVVAVCPVALVWWLRETRLLVSPLAGLGVGIGLSLALAQLGSALWQRHRASRDLLFSELMLWGYLRRQLSERRVASAQRLIGSIEGGAWRGGRRVRVRRQARLLRELAARMDARDPATLGHSRRVARHAWVIARRMGLDRGEAARVRAAAAIHDIGKLETPLAILRKPGALTDAEYEVIKRHPGDGARMSEVLGDARLTEIIRHHHERLDGTGYPSGLAGDEIPIGARIISVADTFDAITITRPYSAPRVHRAALEILHREAGTQLDPDAVRAFCSYYTGRRTLALWASLASLPEALLARLGAAAISAAQAARMSVLALVTGGATLGTVALVPPGGRSVAGTPRQVSAVSPQGSHAAAVALAARLRGGGTAASRRGGATHGRARAAAHLRAPSRAGSPAGAAGAGGAQPAATPAPAATGRAAPAAGAMQAGESARRAGQSAVTHSAGTGAGGGAGSGGHGPEAGGDGGRGSGVGEGAAHGEHGAGQSGGAGGAGGAGDAGEAGAGGAGHGAESPAGGEPGQANGGERKAPPAEAPPGEGAGSGRAGSQAANTGAASGKASHE